MKIGIDGINIMIIGKYCSHDAKEGIMKNYYFIDTDHEWNYQRLVEKWPQARMHLEYDIPCYITAIPMIFDQIEDIIFTMESPVDWIWRWELKYTLSSEDEYWIEKSKETLIPEPPYDLTGSMVQLGRFALEMWGGYKYFSLRDCINSLDEQHCLALSSAISMKIGTKVSTV